MELEEAIKRINLGNCTLFLGAGYSLGAPTECGQSLGTASQVASNLYAECEEEFGVDGTLQDAAELYMERNSTAKLLDYLRSHFMAVDVLQSQQIIGSLPWKRVYTTNYDNVFELSCQKNGKTVTAVSASNDIINYADKRKLCIHINGLIQNLTEESLFKEFKLLTVSYASAEFQENPWSAVFRSDLKSSDAIFFIGFSLNYDLDLQRILYINQEVRDRCFFIVSDNENQRSIRKISEFGNVEAIGLDGLVQKIKRTPTLPIKLSKHYFCFNIQPKSESLPNITPTKVLDFYNWGSIDKSAFYYSTISPEEYKYAIRRTRTNEILDAINNGSNNIIVHSGFGNGKSLTLLSLSILLTQRGYTVYNYIKYYTSEPREVENICKDGKSVIIIDNYAQHKELLETIRTFRTDQILILAERTLINELAYFWLEDLLGNFDCFNVEKLSEEDISSLIPVFSQYGLFGEKASMRVDQKSSYLKYDCFSKFCPILIDLLNAPVFIERIKDLVQNIKLNRHFYEAFVFCLLSPIFEFVIDTDELSFIFNDNKLNSPKFTKDVNICEVIDFTNNKVSIHSSILAQKILQEVDGSAIIDVLCKAFKALNQQRQSVSYSYLLRTLLSHANIQRVINPHSQDKLNQILRFYDTILPLEYCQTNHHFWLQYAIAELFAKDYNAAKVYFDNAYSFAKSKHSADIYQIDNHYARYLLENECVNGNQTTCLNAFLEAHKKLVDPIHKERVRFYPYRVADNYYDFYEHFYNGMKDYEKKVFIKSCQEMYNRSQWYLDQNGEEFVRKSEVRMVSNKIRKILEETGNIESEK